MIVSYTRPPYLTLKVNILNTRPDVLGFVSLDPLLCLFFFSTVDSISRQKIQLVCKSGHTQDKISCLIESELIVQGQNYWYDRH